MRSVTKATILFHLAMPMLFRPYWPTCHVSRQSLDAYITYASENKSSKLSTARQGHVNPVSCDQARPPNRTFKYCTVQYGTRGGSEVQCNETASSSRGNLSRGLRDTQVARMRNAASIVLDLQFLPRHKGFPPGWAAASNWLRSNDP